MIDPAPIRDDHGSFHSRDVEILIVEHPGDNTVRPIPPERLERAKAQREKVRRWLDNTDAPSGETLK